MTSQFWPLILGAMIRFIQFTLCIFKQCLAHDEQSVNISFLLFLNKTFKRIPEQHGT